MYSDHACGDGRGELSQPQALVSDANVSESNRNDAWNGMMTLGLRPLLVCGFSPLVSVSVSFVLSFLE